MEKKLIKSAHDCSDGGLGIALAESSFGGGLGMELDLGNLKIDGLKRNDYVLFSESASRFVVTVEPGNCKRFEKLMKGCTFSCIGKVTVNKRLRIKGINGKMIIDSGIKELKEAWQRTLK